MAELVSHQLGIAILPVNEIAPASLHRGVRAIPLAEPWAKRELLVGVKAHALASPSVKTLIESLTAANRRGQEEEGSGVAVTVR